GVVDGSAGGVLVFTGENFAFPGQDAGSQFESDVLPIFRIHCLKCHGEEPQAGLNLTTVASILKGGTNGPVLVLGDPDKSILLKRVANTTMPPAGALMPLNCRLSTVQVQHNLESTLMHSDYLHRPSCIVVDQPAGRVDKTLLITEGSLDQVNLRSPSP